MKYRRLGRKHFFRFDIIPIPASRPRVSRWGTYYTPTYKRFRKQFQEMIAEFRKGFRPLLGPLKVTVFFEMKKPAKPAHAWPRGDVDNLLKAIWDGCNEFIWRDDSQIVKVIATKHYCETPQIRMLVEELDEAANSGYPESVLG